MFNRLHAVSQFLIIIELVGADPSEGPLGWGSALFLVVAGSTRPTPIDCAWDLPATRVGCVRLRSSVLDSPRIHVCIVDPGAVVGRAVEVQHFLLTLELLVPALFIAGMIDVGDAFFILVHHRKLVTLWRVSTNSTNVQNVNSRVLELPEFTYRFDECGPIYPHGELGRCGRGRVMGYNEFWAF
ncbi:hypothetical protein PIB30_031089 [Stylosanthes scabra]|uniref:Secreted protein n=1 Tax=Stylosanthes scabra TaxID=79078 RepID=A0ABU6UAJ3_9FABA|nr:hypothetical protein [Stylosanthes scabra]